MNKKIELQIKITEAHLLFHKNEERFLELIKDLIDKQSEIIIKISNESKLVEIINSFNNTMGLLERNQVMYNKSHDRFLRMNFLEEIEDDYSQRLLGENSQNNIVDNKKNNDNGNKIDEEILNMDIKNDVKNKEKYSSENSNSSNSTNYANEESVEFSIETDVYYESEETDEDRISIELVKENNLNNKEDINRNSTKQVFEDQFLKTKILNIVAELTGYPEEVINFDMNIKSDLGLDSFKVIEVFTIISKEIPTIREKDFSEISTKVNSLNDIYKVINEINKKKTRAVSCFVPKFCKIVNEKYLNKIETKNEIYLIIDNGLELHTEICEKLIQKGIGCITLSYLDFLEHNKLNINNFSEVEKRLDKLFENNNITGLINLNNCLNLSDELGEIISNNEFSTFKLFIEIMNYIKKIKINGEFKLISILNLNGYFGFGINKPFSVIRVGISGAIRVLKSEWEKLETKIVDIDYNLSKEEFVEYIVRELYFDYKHLNIGVNKKGDRYKLMYLKQAFSSYRDESIKLPNHRSVFLTVEGFCEKTFECLKKLAIEFKSNFIVIGNESIIENEPKWAKGLEDEASLKYSAINYYKNKHLEVERSEITKDIFNIIKSRVIAKNIEKLEKQGSSVVYLQVDINNLFQLKNGLKYAENRIGRITDIIYGLNHNNHRKAINVAAYNIFGIKNILECVDKKIIGRICFLSILEQNEELDLRFITTRVIIDKLANYLFETKNYEQVFSMKWDLFRFDSSISESTSNLMEISKEDGADIFLDIIKGYYNSSSSYDICY